MAVRTWDQQAGGTDDVQETYVRRQIGWTRSECGHRSPLYESKCEFHANPRDFAKKVLGATA